MKLISRVIGFAWGGLMLASVFGAIAASAAKRTIVPIDTPDADEIRLAAIFEPLKFESRAMSFRGGSVDCWYGGGVIDLRDAVLDPAGAVLRVRAICGGAQLVLPDGWHVVTSVRGIGGIADRRQLTERPADAPLLTIEGLVIFGGFAVTSEFPEEEARALDDAIRGRARWRHPMGEAEPEAVPVG